MKPTLNEMYSEVGKHVFLYSLLLLHSCESSGSVRSLFVLTVTVVSLFCFLVGDEDPGLCGEKKDAPLKRPSSASDMTVLHIRSINCCSDGV